MIIDFHNLNGGGGGGYVLPAATQSTLGGVKIGSGVTVTNDGTISVSGSSYTLPPATQNSLGGVIIGSGMSVDSAGTISVSASTDTGTVETMINNALSGYTEDLENGDIVPARAGKKITQSEYDQLVNDGEVDENTLYLIIADPEE